MSSSRNYRQSSILLHPDDLFSDFATEGDDPNAMHTFLDHAASGNSDKIETPIASMTTSLLEVPATQFVHTQPIDDFNDTLLSEATDEHESDAFKNSKLALLEDAFVTHPTQIPLANTFLSETHLQNELEGFDESVESEIQSSKKIKTDNAITTAFDASTVIALFSEETDSEDEKIKKEQIHSPIYLPVAGKHVIPKAYRASIVLHKIGCNLEHRLTMLNKWGESITIEVANKEYLYRKRLMLKNAKVTLTKAQLPFLRVNKMEQLIIEQNGVTEEVIAQYRWKSNAKLEKSKAVGLDEDKEASEEKKKDKPVKSADHIYLPVNGIHVVSEHFETKTVKRGKLVHTYALIPNHPQTGFSVPLSTKTSLPNARLIVKKTNAVIKYEQLLDLTREQDGELYITLDGKKEHVVTMATNRRKSKKNTKDVASISNASSEDDQVLTTQITQGETQNVLTRSSSFSQTLFASASKTGVNQMFEKPQQPQRDSEVKQKLLLKRKS